MSITGLYMRMSSHAMLHACALSPVMQSSILKAASFTSVDEPPDAVVAFFFLLDGLLGFSPHLHGTVCAHMRLLLMQAEQTAPLKGEAVAAHEPCCFVLLSLSLHLHAMLSAINQLLNCVLTWQAFSMQVRLSRGKLRSMLSCWCRVESGLQQAKDSCASPRGTPTDLQLPLGGSRAPSHQGQSKCLRLASLPDLS